MSQGQSKGMKDGLNQTRTTRLLGPKIAVGIASTITIGAIVYSHYSQVRDKEAMKEGVRRDKERIRMKKLMRKRQEQSNVED